jgi:4-carboxymuconolactone decarboxylase
MTTSATFATGHAIRTQVLGSAYVEKSTQGLDDFSRPFYELATEYCWGSVWGRPGLDRRTRSLLNLAMLSALNRSQEFKMHVRGAVNNGCSKEEVMETLLQVGIYCGVPAGAEAFRLAKEVFAEIAAEPAANGAAP